MPAKKKKAAKKKAKVYVVQYQCPGNIPAPRPPCNQARLPRNINQLAMELEAYFMCLCAWQQQVAKVVNACCATGPDNVPPPPPPPF